jgi:glycerophosphoryl diester phosphodiesterase
LTLAAVVAAAPLVAVAGDTPFDVQGHRGCRGLLPENTLAAFERALELGVTTLEMDLQVTKDRVLIVSHDQQVDPTYCRRPDGGKLQRKPFVEMRLDELTGLDCGSTTRPEFPEQRPVSGAGIPTLDEVLARVADSPVQVSVEIKLQKARYGISPEEFAELVVTALGRHKMLDRSIVQSFNPEALRAVGALAPDLPRALLVRKPGQYDDLLAASGATILSPKHTQLREADVRRFQERGIPVIPWTVNEPGDIRRMLEWGVDGVISDYPDRVIAALDERAVNP